MLVREVWEGYWVKAPWELRLGILSGLTLPFVVLFLVLGTFYDALWLQLLAVVVAMPSILHGPSAIFAPLVIVWELHDLAHAYLDLIGWDKPPVYPKVRLDVLPGGRDSDSPV